jgi:hypothetical protein
MSIFVIVLGGCVAIRVRFFMILYQPYHVLVVLHLDFYYNHRTSPETHIVTCAKTLLMKKVIIVKLANLMHILSV